MSNDLVRLIGSLRSIAVPSLGIVLSVIPLALWVAWTETVLLTVLAVGAAGAVLLVVLTEDEASMRRGPHAPRRPEARPMIEDEAVAEIHKVFPLTYHHSLKPNTRFEDAMEKVARRMKAPDADGRA
jgi:hypothetical protein